jgi:hypothetical protein
MRSKAEKGTKKQVVVTGSAPAPERIRQLLLPMVSGMAAAKQDLMEWVQEVGLSALEEVFESERRGAHGTEGEAPGGADAPSLGFDGHAAAVWWTSDSCEPAAGPQQVWAGGDAS